MRARSWTVAWTAVAVGVAFAAFGVGGCAPPESQGPAATPTPAAGQVVPSAQTTPIAVGNKGIIGPYTLTITNVAHETAIRDAEGKRVKAHAGKEILVLTLKFGNGSESPKGVGPSALKLAVNDGARIQPLQTGGIDFISNMPKIPAKGEATTMIAFEVRKRQSGLTLTWVPFVEGSAAQTKAVFSVK